MIYINLFVFILSIANIILYMPTSIGVLNVSVVIYRKDRPRRDIPVYRGDKSFLFKTLQIPCIKDAETFSFIQTVAIGTAVYSGYAVFVSFAPNLNIFAGRNEKNNRLQRIGFVPEMTVASLSIQNAHKQSVKHDAAKGKTVNNIRPLVFHVESRRVTFVIFCNIVHGRGYNNFIRKLYTEVRLRIKTRERTSAVYRSPGPSSNSITMRRYALFDL